MAVFNWIVGLLLPALAPFLGAFLVLSFFKVNVAQSRLSFASRIACTQFLTRLRRFVQFPGNVNVILSGNQQPFARAGVLSQLECLGDIFATAPRLAEASIIPAHLTVRHGKIRIEIYGALLIRQISARPFLPESLLARGVEL